MDKTSIEVLPLNKRLNPGDIAYLEGHRASRFGEFDEEKLKSEKLKELLITYHHALEAAEKELAHAKLTIDNIGFIVEEAIKEYGRDEERE